MAASEEKQRPSSLYMDLKELRVRFSEVDIHNKGYIEYEGLQQMISNMEGFDSSASSELMAALDRDGDGKVTFEDFQILFTLERDAVKEQRQLQDDSSSFLSTSSSAGYVTALYSPRNSLFFSPEKPQGHSVRNLNSVSDSPDLSMHVRSLQKRRRSSDDPLNTSRRQSLGGESKGGGDQVLEDTGTVGNTLSSSPTKFTPNSNSFMGLELIEKELQSICEEDVVHRNDISKLCNRLGIDATDEQEFLSLWEDLVTVSDNNQVSVELMYDSIKQRETIAMVTSTPANPQLTSSKEITKQHSRPKLISMAPLTISPDEEGVAGGGAGKEHSQITSTSSSIDENDINEDNGDDVSDEEDGADMFSNWTDGRHFAFHEPMQVARPSSAREGSRLSKGHLSESSLRQTSMMQNFYSEFQQLQKNLEQVSQERDNLRQQLARAESDKKRLIQEGEESLLNLQRQKETKIRKLEKEFNTKQKGLEASLSFDYQTQQEYLQEELTDVNQKYRDVKAVNEEMKEDLKYYHAEHQEMLERIDKLHNTINQKDDKISLLQERLGVTSESQSDFDLELHSAKIQELEEELQVRVDHNESLRQTNTELQDQVDELKAECEKLRQKCIEEKRKRQRRASDVTDYHRHSQQSKPHHHHKSRHGHGGRSSRSGGGRQLPSISPIPDYPNEGVDYEGREVTTPLADDQLITMEQWMITSDDESYPSIEADQSTTHDDIAAISSTSLLEEIRVSDEQHNLEAKIEELQNHCTSLDNTCLELRAKINKMEENNMALKNELELEQNIKEARIREDGEKIANLQEYISEQKKQLEELTESNGSLQHNINQQSAHISQIVNERVTLENQYRQLEARMDSKERELKRTETKACLAIIDLNNKEKEYNSQQEEVEQLEKELHLLQRNCDQYVNRIEEMERHLIDGEVERKQLIDAQTELQSKYEQVLEALQNQNELSNMVEDNVLQCWSPDETTSPPLDQSSFASNVSQNEILHQMKGQLEQLQSVLIEKGTDEGSEIELSFVQELLTINTDMEQSLLHQHQQYNQLVCDRDERIKMLEDQLTETQAQLDESRDVTDPYNPAADISALQEERATLQTALAIKNKEKLQAISKLEHELNEQRKSAEFSDTIIRKQKEEIEKLNHYLGKARSKQVNCDTKNEEMEKHIEEQNQQLLSQSQLIQQLQGVSMSEPLLHHWEEEQEVVEGGWSPTNRRLPAALEAELLTSKESLMTAEVLISDMRQQVLDLYKHVMKPSDSQASDLLDFTDLVNHLKEAFDSMNEELLHNKNTQQQLEQKLLTHSHDYDSLYSEHDEEVKALQQQNDSLLLQLIDAEKNIESKLTEQIKISELEKSTAIQEANAKLLQISKDNESMNKALRKALEDKQSLKQAIESAHDKIEDLNKCKAHLINLVKTISIQALASLSPVH